MSKCDSGMPMVLRHLSTSRQIPSYAISPPTSPDSGKAYLEEDLLAFEDIKNIQKLAEKRQTSACGTSCRPDAVLTTVNSPVSEISTAWKLRLTFDFVVYRIDTVLQVQLSLLARSQRNMPSSRGRLLALFDSLVSSVGINTCFSPCADCDENLMKCSTAHTCPNGQLINIQKSVGWGLTSSFCLLMQFKNVTIFSKVEIPSLKIN